MPDKDDIVEKVDKKASKWLDRRHPLIKYPIKAVAGSLLAIGTLTAVNKVVEMTPTTIDDDAIDALYGE